MDTAPRRTARRLTLAVTVAAGLVIVAALGAALWLPGDLGLTTRSGPAGTTVIAWVAPDGPAWGADVRPGDRVVGRAPRGPSTNRLVIRVGKRRVVLGPDATMVDPLDAPVAGLGLLVLLMGAVVILKGRDRAAAGAFWRMSVAAALALGVSPAGFHGVPWAIALTFVSLSLFGPALLDLTLTFPSMGPRMGAPALYRRAIWLPAVVLVALYPLCWWRPIPLFAVVQVAGDAVLASYILAACVRIGWVLRGPRSPLQQAQLRWLALGLSGGFAPVVALNLLPFVLTGHGLTPIQLSILPLALLPLCVGTAIVRVDFLGITSLMRRRTLHGAVTVALLAGVAAIAGLLIATGPGRWDWPVPAGAAVAGALTALGVLALRPTLTRWAERLVLHDVYDTGDTLRRVSLDLAQAPPSALGALVVTRLSNVLNLTDALLLTPSNQWSYAHPRTTDPVAVGEAVVRRALHLLADPSPCGAFVERAAGQPILFLPIWGDHALRAVLCLGPKRSDDPYTAQDHALLDTLVRHLALTFSNQQLHTQLMERAVARIAPPHSEELLCDYADVYDGPRLTPQQLVTLRYLAEGLTNKQIAERLVVVEKTVHKHVEAVLDKLEARNRTEAVAIARRKRLLPPD